MSSEERKVILKMVEESKITAQQAAQLLKALDEQLTAGEVNALDMEMPVEEQPDSRSARDGDEFEQVVNVDQRSGEWPRHITLGFLLPLGLASWLLQNLGHSLRGMKRQRVEEMLSLLAAANVREPLIVNVDEGERGERVQVYIG
jgi:hypothetical protein